MACIGFEGVGSTVIYFSKDKKNMDNNSNNNHNYFNATAYQSCFIKVISANQFRVTLRLR